MSLPTSTYSVESADSRSPLAGLASEPSAFPRLTHTQAQSSESTGQTLQTSGTSPAQTSGPTQAQLFSQVDSPASRSALPGSKEARAMTVSSGRQCSQLLPQSSQLGSLVKMLLVSSAWSSTACLLTWKAKATPQFRLLFQLSPSMPDTDEIESGLWQMPVADDSVDREKGKFNSRGEPKLSAQVKLWPTPRNNTGPSTDPRHLSLCGAVKLFPTPTVCEVPRTPESYAARRARPRATKGGGDGPNLATVAGGQLNPQWVEWLMGYPEGWTELSASEMPSSRRSLTKS